MRRSLALKRLTQSISFVCFNGLDIIGTCGFHELELFILLVMRSLPAWLQRRVVDSVQAAACFNSQYVHPRACLVAPATPVSLRQIFLPYVLSVSLPGLLATAQAPS
jgi:hypothetical protein